MTVLLAAAAFFSGHIRKSANFLKDHGYITDTISESRSNHRLYAIDYSVRKSLFFVISEILGVTQLVKHKPDQPYKVL